MIKQKLIKIYRLIMTRHPPSIWSKTLIISYKIDKINQTECLNDIFNILQGELNSLDDWH